jgi:hypothetical protein
MVFKIVSDIVDSPVETEPRRLRCFVFCQLSSRNGSELLHLHCLLALSEEVVLRFAHLTRLVHHLRVAILIAVVILFVLNRFFITAKELLMA